MTDSPHPSHADDDVDIGDDADFEEDFEDERGAGFLYFLLAVVVAVAIVGGVFGALQDFARRGTLDQIVYAFQSDVSLLPDSDFRPAGADRLVQIFLTRDGRKLTPYPRRLRRPVGDAERGRLVVEELFAAPRSATLSSALPEGSRSLGFFQIGQTGYLNLSSEFLKPVAPGPGGERLAVYALVNSLVLSVESLDAVQLLVEGQPIDTAWGWLDLSSPLGANLAVIE